jgi:tetratricopeptide (TPR) repeat protein
MTRGADDLAKLLMSAQWALARDLSPRDLVPMLRKVVARAEPGSAAALFAQRHLGRLLLKDSPWRAARLAWDVLRHQEDDEAWAILGLAHTLLGNYRCAKTAYYRALALAPNCPAYAHNLGHLLDVALDRPRDGLRYLACAHRAEPNEPELASSYAHALARSGRLDDARRILRRALSKDEAGVERILTAWLGAHPPGSPPASDASRGVGRAASRWTRNR